MRRRRSRAKRKSSSLSPDSGQSTYSLFGEILDWMLAPLLFLWPISIIVTNHVALNIANKPYDQALADEVLALKRQVELTPSGSVRVDLPSSATRMLRSDAEDTVYFQIIAPDGHLLAGDPEIPMLPRGALITPNKVEFRDADIQGEDIRVAFMSLQAESEDPSEQVLIQVAETRHKRNGLGSQIVSGVLLPQFAIIPLAVVLVWFGLSRGIAPLHRLQSQIRRRRPGDLSPVPETVPDEVKPVVMAFNDLMARLEDNLAAQQRFIADAAHQMRTPLAGMKMQMELGMAETDPEQWRRSLIRAHFGAERATRLINQLLALARAEASSETVHMFEHLDLDLLVREVAAEYVPQALTKSIDLGVETAHRHVCVRGAPVLLHELVANLIDNAIKYTPAGGRVTAAVSIDGQDDNIVSLTVQDNGPGVPEEDRERVFERFYRALGTGAEGSGLGLAIVREVAELHGGSVHFTTGEHGVGSCVRVRIPHARLPFPHTG